MNLGLRGGHVDGRTGGGGRAATWGPWAGAGVGRSSAGMLLAAAFAPLVMARARTRRSAGRRSRRRPVATHLHDPPAGVRRRGRRAGPAHLAPLSCRAFQIAGHRRSPLRSAAPTTIGLLAAPVGRGSLRTRTGLALRATARRRRWRGRAACERGWDAAATLAGEAFRRAQRERPWSWLRRDLRGTMTAGRATLPPRSWCWAGGTRWCWARALLRFGAAMASEFLFQTLGLDVPDQLFPDAALRAGAAGTRRSWLGGSKRPPI